MNNWQDLFKFLSNNSEAKRQGNEDCTFSTTLHYQCHLGKPFEHIYLTPREAECVYCFSKGYNLIQTSKLLDLSHHTINFCLSNIQRKLDCHRKSELFKILRECGVSIKTLS